MEKGQYLKIIELADSLKVTQFNQPSDSLVPSTTFLPICHLAFKKENSTLKATHSVFEFPSLLYQNCILKFCSLVLVPFRINQIFEDNYLVLLNFSVLHLTLVGFLLSRFQFGHQAIAVLWPLSLDTIMFWQLHLIFCM